MPHDLHTHATRLTAPHKKHGNLGDNLNLASISTIVKTLQEGLKSGSKEQPLSDHLFGVATAPDLLELRLLLS